MPRTSSARPAASPTSAAAPPPDGRDFAGRFARYNAGGPGNPFARRTAALRKAFCSSVSPRGMRELGRALHKRALAGDNAAARLLVAYGVGRPAPASDPDTLDKHEVGVLAAGPALIRLLAEAAQGMLPQAVCEIARAVLPALSAARFDDFAQKLRADPAPPAKRHQVEDEDDDYEGDGEEEDGGDDLAELGGGDPTLTPEWAACLASVNPPPDVAPPLPPAPAPPRPDGRHGKSPNGTDGTPPGTARHASEGPAGGAAPRPCVPIVPPPADSKRVAVAPPPAASGGGKQGKKKAKRQRDASRRGRRPAATCP